MSACLGCGTHDGVHEMHVHDYGTDPTDPDLEFYCPACATRLQIFCPRHQRPHVSVHDSSDEEEEDLPHSYSVCQLCALETVRGAVRTVKLEALVIIEMAGGTDDLHRFAHEIGDPDALATIDDLDTVIYGAVLSATLEGETLSEFVTELAFDGESQTMH